MYVCCAFVGLDNKLYKMDGTYIKKEISYAFVYSLFNRLKTKNVEVLFYPMLTAFRKNTVLEGFPCFAFLFSWQGQNVSEDYFAITHLPRINQIQKCINNQQMHFNINAAIYSQYSHQSVSAIFKVIFLLQEHNCN